MTLCMQINLAFIYCTSVVRDAQFPMFRLVVSCGNTSLRATCATGCAPIPFPSLHHVCAGIRIKTRATVQFGPQHPS